MDQNIPCPPPVNRSLLTLPLRAHRADRVWYEPDYIDSCLKCVNCPSAAFQDEERDERVVNTLAYAGFLGVEHIARMKLDHSLISALVERWRPETHTFHLPFGEVGISLQDVAMILGLPIRGMPLSGPTIRDKAEWMNLCTQSCGFTPIASDIRTSDIMMSAITRLPIVPYSTDEEVEQHTRSLIWQLLGGFLFPDTSATRIRLYFLEVLQGDLALTRRWSWGSAVLGHLYHNLCNGAKWGTKQVGGCMHLLQIWAWSRISMLRPSVLQVIQHDHLPYGCRWIVPKSYKGSPRHCIRLYRDSLDRMSESQFDFVPYASETLSPIILHEAPIWSARVMLIFCNMAEMHYPDRFLRQFHIRQDIPDAPLAGSDHHGNRSNIATGALAMWANIQDHIYFLDYDQQMFVEATNRYKKWYKKYGMTRVQNPSHIVPTTGYTPTAHQWGIVQQGIYELYQLSINDASNDDIQKRIRKLAVDAGDEDMIHRGMFHYEDEGGSHEEDDAHEHEGGREESSSHGVSFDQPPPQFSTHQSLTFNQPPPYYESYQFTRQPDDFVDSFLSSSYLYGDPTVPWNSGGGDGAGPSTQH
ncbi:unnamed protein product [Cuscuta epithymum]|uniref:Aminotransferase-like plant mobile domain-containing protein n=2 Tax=Cuscuta epithymum TaxID=186058 RepID=A0AAV0GH34_9ASTE|nr:unnamed protein product [Cuscuta epithymum]